MLADIRKFKKDWTIAINSYTVEEDFI